MAATTETKTCKVIYEIEAKWKDDDSKEIAELAAKVICCNCEEEEEEEESK